MLCVYVLYPFLILLFLLVPIFFFFFFNDTATTEIYTLSLHDALPIWFTPMHFFHFCASCASLWLSRICRICMINTIRSEEHTSELQSPCNLVCRLLLEKKKKIISRAPLAI